MTPPSGDTSVEIEAIVVERWRRMSVDERVTLVERICRDVKVVAIAGIR